MVTDHRKCSLICSTRPWPRHRRAVVFRSIFRRRRKAEPSLSAGNRLAIEMARMRPISAKHSTLTESVGMAAEVAEGVCTDLPPAKRKLTEG